MANSAKIARLPRNIRQELNRRLLAGEQGPSLVAWLNSLPEVKQMLKPGEGPINEQNLSAWRQGGYQTWLEHLQLIARMKQVDKEVKELEAKHGPLLDYLGMMAASQYVEALAKTRHLPAKERERKVRLHRMICQDIMMLRKSDQQAKRSALEQKQWALELKQLEEEQKERERQKRSKQQ